MPAPRFMQEVFLGNRSVLEKYRHSRAAADSHFLFFRSHRKTGGSAFHDEAGEFFSVNLCEYDVDIGEAAIRYPHLLPIQYPVLAIRRKHRARACCERIRSGLRFGEAIAGEQLAGRYSREVFLLLRFGTKVHNWDRPDTRVASARNGEGTVSCKFFREDRGGYFVEAYTTVLFGNRAAQQADFAGLFQHLRHQPFFMLFERGYFWHNFFLYELFGSLADQALIVRHRW